MTSMGDMNFAFNQGLDSIRRKIVSEFEAKKSELERFNQTNRSNHEVWFKHAAKLETEIATARRYIEMIDKMFKQ